MKTKALLLALTTTAFAFGAKAQETTTFGLRAGVNFQNINGKEFNGDDTENKLKTGFHVGVNAEIPIASEFYLQPGVLFTTKGAKSKDDDDIKVNLSYIEVPINFLYKPALGTGKLLLGIGPYIAFAVGGKASDEDGEESDFKFKNEVSAAEYLQDPYARRIDAGGNFLVGYEFSNKFSAQLNAQLGMLKINPEIEGVSNDETKYKNTGFGISLGYRF
ncbi:porin family protein [Longitalea luteola]|uniref:porin family protein n=1 Tax=Longitalea luteola TaxID=2812563 RepID=UPI001A956DCE|nr:porin family protein [Longitalea luteola]